MPLLLPRRFTRVSNTPYLTAVLDCHVCPVCSNIAAGKTCLARGFVREYTADPHLIVSSPTFLLDHVYAAARYGAPPYVARCDAGIYVQLHQ